MLSRKDIQKELGKGIAIVPFCEDNIKENSVNLSASEIAWGTISQTIYFNSMDIHDDDVYLQESEIPSCKKTKYKEYFLYAGDSVVLARENRKIILLLPHATTFVETSEVLSTNGDIGGTCHSKVGTAAQGIGHIGTMMGPNYSGHCFVPLHNPTDRIIPLPVGETFISVVFNYLKTPIAERNRTTGGHTDKFAALGIHASDDELKKLNSDWKRSHQTIINRMNEDSAFRHFKKNLRKQIFSSIFSKKNIIGGFILAILCILLGLLASYIDNINGTTVWTDRFWTVLGSGVLVTILQIFLDKKA